MASNEAQIAATAAVKDQSPEDDRSSKKSDSDSQQFGSETTAQKRRRVTRACDECRRKKIKCDGKQPCTHCTVYSYDCTYDQPSNRRRNPPPQYIEALEQKLTRVQAVLHRLAPTLDTSDENLQDIADGRKNPPSGLNVPVRGQHDKLVSPAADPHKMISNDANLESMVDSTGQLDIDEQGNWDYYGHSSNMSFLRRVRDRLGDLDGPERLGDSYNQRQPRKTSIPLPVPGSPKDLLGNIDSPFDNADIGADELPSKEFALALCNAALDDCCAILNIVHHPSFYERVHRIYSISPENFQDQDHKFLPLLYVTLALGCLFAKDGDSELELHGYKSATETGYRYFWAARQLMDITDCRDLTSLQAIVFMIMFLQCSAKLATCYAYIGVALRSAIRMGLHRSFQDSFNPIEAECRKRVFWTIRKMDIYVGAILGLPQTLSEDDIDQEFPTAVGDEHVRADGVFVPLNMPSDDIPAMAAANANFKLCKVIIRIVRTIYPIKGFPNSQQQPARTYSVSYNAIRQIEMDLQTWMEELPPQLVPRDKAPRKLVRMQQLLRLAYAHAQLMLYRPFLHYVSSKHQITSVNHRSYACGGACVSVSRNIIHITSEMRKQGLLQGSYWFSMYTTFFGILSLVFFALENPQSANQQEALADAMEGKETLARLAKRSMAADRCTSTLTTLFNHLGPLLEKDAQATSNTGRKRGAPSMGSGSSLDSHLPQQSRQATAQGRSQKPMQAPLRSNTGPQAILSASPAPGSGSSAYSTPNFAQQQLPRFGLQNQRGQPMSGDLPYLPSQFQTHNYASSPSDMSALMFPSDNPFNYPNQPMNTLEQQYAFTGNQSFQQPPSSAGPQQDMFLPASTSGAETMSADDHIDVQLFGPLPPYMHGNPGQMPWSMSNNIPNAGNNAPQTGAEMWNQQARSHGLPGMNLDDIFAGEDWSGT